MNPIETVWSQLKTCAAEHAARGDRPPRDCAEALVVRLMNRAHVTPWPPPDVISFYVDELIAMIEERRVPAGTDRQAR